MRESTGQFCKECLYPLQSLVETRCPECGRAFDPADSATYLTSARRLMRWEGIGGFALQFAAVLWIGSTLRAHREPVMFWIPPILMIALGVGFAISGLRKGGFANTIIGPLALLLAIWHALVLIVFWYRN